MGDEIDFDTDVPPPYLCWQMGAEAEAQTAHPSSRPRRYKCGFAGAPSRRPESGVCYECSRPVDDPRYHRLIADDDHRCWRATPLDSEWWACVLPEGHEGKCSAL